MWPFKKEPDLSALQEDFAKLRREFQALEAEWSNAYDKMRSMMGRMAKRAELAAKAESPAQPGESGDNGTSSLSQRQQEFQERILRRRNRMGVQQ